VLHVPGLDRDTIEAARARVESPMTEDTADELVEAQALLASLDEFGRYIASAVADHGHAQAFALFQAFERYAEELAEEKEDAGAQGRYEAAVERLQAVAREAEGQLGDAARELRAALAELDAARKAVGA
jgi:GTP1/Obg family GTP-binding protein